MGDQNQFNFITTLKDQLQGPYLEIGSKDYGSTQDIRSVFARKDKYTGIDMEAGAGVDKVLDFTLDFPDIDAALQKERFGTIFCLSVLEHCNNPFKMAQNMTRLLKQDGQIVISAPFVWEIHGYPNDYWRFTPEGIKILFPTLKFESQYCLAATSKINEFENLDHDDFARIVFSFSTHIKKGHYWRAFSAKFIRFLAQCGIYSWIAGYRYLYPPANIFMVGKNNPS